MDEDLGRDDEGGATGRVEEVDKALWTRRLDLLSHEAREGGDEAHQRLASVGLHSDPLHEPREPRH